MKETIINKIDILPAIFIEERDNGILVECLLDKKNLQYRLFDKKLLEGIKNPNLLFIGIMTGVGMLQINVCDANEFEDLFKKKYNVLLK